VYRDEYCRYYDIHSIENLCTVYRDEYCRYYDIHSIENLCQCTEMNTVDIMMYIV